MDKGEDSPTFEQFLNVSELQCSQRARPTVVQDRAEGGVSSFTR